MMRLVPIIALAFFLPTTLFADRLKVGIRTDAKPFVYVEGDVRKGFLYDMCKSTLELAGIEYDFVNTSAADRTKRLSPEGDLDMLCDPLTMTRERAGQFLFSPIVFISGGSFLFSKSGSNASYLTARKLVADQLAPISHDGQAISRGTGKVYTVAGSGEKVPAQRAAINCADLKQGQIASIRIGVIKGSTAPEIIRNTLRLETPEIASYAYETICYEEFDTHTVGITALCQNSNMGKGFPLSYYFGDRDIIVAYYEFLKGNDNAPGPCAALDGEDKVTVSNKFFSTEPYGFAFSSRMDTAQVVQFQKALLTVFSDLIPDVNNPGSLTSKPFQWFQEYFPGKQPSPTVRSVFSTLIVPEK